LKRSNKKTIVVGPLRCRENGITPNVTMVAYGKSIGSV